MSTVNTFTVTLKLAGAKMCVILCIRTGVRKLHVVNKSWTLVVLVIDLGQA